jgi:hypothetical protein
VELWEITSSSQNLKATMQTSSVKGIRRKIRHLQEKGRRIPRGLSAALKKAIEKNGDYWQARKGLLPENPMTRLPTKPRAKPIRGYLPGKFGAASKGRRLTPEEITDFLRKSAGTPE